ncbi:MAG: chromosome segregation protein SMC, partial [Clostridia bacterium]|nr:chromosome segregation protein SMC [Clostridia bacterium]
MVGQGKIDAIISTKSNERRDIFEEASGISKYRYRKIESERKLAAADENLLRLKDIMQELESRVGPLKSQSEKAERFLELAGEKKELEIGLWLNSLENFKENLRAQEAKITACEVLYKEIEDSLSEYDLTTEKNSELFNEISCKIDEARLNISTYTEQIAVLSGEISVFENDIAHTTADIERLTGEISELKGSDESARGEIDNNKAKSEEKLLKKEELNAALLKAEQDLTELLTNSESYSRKIEELSSSLNSLTSVGADLKVAILTAETSSAELNERNAALVELISTKTSEKDALEIEFKETEKLVDELEGTVNECENAIKGYEMRLNSRREKANELKGKLDDTRLDIESKKRRVQMLRDLEKNMEGFAHSVKAVMKDADSGVLRGVYGPVSSVIKVKKEYSVAVETALGNALQNIIVDTEADAKRAINALKESGSGRATLLPVNSVKARPFTEKGYEDMFGYVGRANEIIECDAKFREIIDYLLGAVVITEDIDTAVSIAKKFNYHFKVVSLDGQVINAGGSLTGGSLIKNAGILSRKDDINRINAQIESLTDKEKSVSKLYDEAVADVAKVEAEIVNARASLTTANEDKIRALAELKRIGDLVAAANDAEKAYIAEKTANEQKSAAFKLTLEQSTVKATEVESEKARIQAEIEGISGGRDELSAKREEYSEKITEIKLQIIECAKDAETFAAMALSLEQAMSNRDERIAELEAEISKNNELIASRREDIANIEAAKEEIKNNIISSEESIAKFIEQRNDIEKQNSALRSTEKEKTSEREKISGELARLTERKENMLAEYDNIIKQLYEEYQLTRTDAENMGIVIENPTEAKRRLAEIKSSIRSLGNVNVAAIEEYKEVSERYEFMSAQIADVEKSRAELGKLINQLTKQMQEMFIEGFAKINESFTKTFTELFGGGHAELVLTDPDNVLESGIDINAKLPGKNVPSLDGLSGGEKALVALSIYFSIMRVNAPPFCFLDEVDTALDDINVDRFAQYMKSSDFGTQFICVTHRRGTMEAADMLYGVTMQEKGITKLLQLNVAELEKKLGELEI